MKVSEVTQILKAIMQAHPEMSREPDSDFVKIMDILLVIDPSVNEDKAKFIDYLNGLLKQARIDNQDDQIKQIELELQKINDRP